MPPGGRERKDKKATPRRGGRDKGDRRKKGANAADDEERAILGNVDDALSDDFTVYSAGADSETTGTLDDFFNEEDSATGGEPVAADGADEGAVGVGGGGGRPTTAQRHYKQLTDALNAASEVTSEKRATKRETVFRRLFKALTQYSTPTACGDAIESNLDDALIPACLFGVSRGTSPAEQYAACRCLEALAMLLGGDRDEYCEVIEEPLRRAVMATGRAHVVRAAALRAMCLSNFICSTDISHTNALLDLCEAVCGEKWRGEAVHPFLRATALDCWALLSTTVSDAYLAGGDDGRGVAILPLLQKCLDHDNTDLREAAGECVTLIHEARLDLGIDDEETNTTERRYRQGSWDGSESEVLMDELRQRMADLSVESGYHMSKKAKKEQRSVFREFMATVVDDEPPNHVVSFRGGDLTLTSWREIIQLNFIRHCLQGGFQVQLMTNPTLLSIFGADGDRLRDNATLSQLEKRLMMSKNSDAAKAADKDMNRRRKARNNAKNLFITCDGEGI